MEFQVDCCDSSKEATEMMAALFERNPVGVEFNPDEWLTQLRAGGNEAQLRTRQTHEPVSPVRGSFSKLVGTS